MLHAETTQSSIKNPAATHHSTVPLPCFTTQHKLVRFGFETQLEAQEWYALLCIALGTISLDCPSLDGLATALAASKKARSYNTTN
jgi:hypothetical protein